MNASATVSPPAPIEAARLLPSHVLGTSRAVPFHLCQNAFESPIQDTEELSGALK